MSDFVFPHHLVSDIRAAWAAGSDLPPLPPDAQLQHLVDVAFLASLVTEEGRPIAFTLCCTPVAEAVRRTQLGAEVETWRFTAPRRFEVQELRRLAVATQPDSTALWVTFDPHEGQLEIRGLLNLGMSWTLAQMGLPTQDEPLPHALTIRVGGPGTLIVYQHQKAVLQLSAGQLSRSSALPAMVPGLRNLLNEGARHFLARLAPEADGHTWVMVGRAYASVLFSLVHGIQRRGHGGVLVLANAAALANEAVGRLLQPKYRLARANYLAEHFQESLEALLRLGPGAGWQAIQSTSAQRQAYQGLFEATSFVANLAGTDGAILMGTDLSLVGFGVEIAIDTSERVPVLEAPHGAIDEARPLALDQYGMRHRSAIQLCAALPGVVCLVVSHDGHVGLAFSEGGRVYFWPHLDSDLAMR